MLGSLKQSSFLIILGASNCNFLSVIHKPKTVSIHWQATPPKGFLPVLRNLEGSQVHLDIRLSTMACSILYSGRVTYLYIR